MLACVLTELLVAKAEHAEGWVLLSRFGQKISQKMRETSKKCSRKWPKSYCDRRAERLRAGQAERMAARVELLEAVVGRELAG